MSSHATNCRTSGQLYPVGRGRGSCDAVAVAGCGRAQKYITSFYPKREDLALYHSIGKDKVYER